MKRGNLVVISGPSGVGKSTIRTKMLEKNKNFWYSISMTTRKPREGEVNGVDYYFVSIDEFLENIKNNNFVEYAEVYEGTYYGTPKDKVNEMLDKGYDVILEIDVEGALNIKKTFPQALLIFVDPPTIDHLYERLNLRHTDNEKEIKRRLDKAHKEVTFKNQYDYVVVNHDIDATVNEIMEIVESKKL